MPQKCHAVNCNYEAIAKGLCNTHYKRLYRNGHLENTRAKDWGKREKHPAYKTWCNLVRHHRHRISTEWLNDFWSFVKDIPEKPSDKARSCRPNQNEPWSALNFYWKEPRFNKKTKANRANYMRKWQRTFRAANPNYGKNSFLKKHYGVTLDWYNEQLVKQNGVCAICGQPETAIIHGKQISLAVDHCHDTGKVRKLLCRACNQAIGLLRHDRNLLRSAIEYLDA